MNETAPACQTCGRPLDQAGEPLSVDCGGDCWGCVGQIEADAGYEPSVRAVADECARGERPQPESQTDFIRRGAAAIVRSEAARDWRPAEEVLDRMQARLDLDKRRTSE